jgi:hypothetical protein
VFALVALMSRLKLCRGLDALGAVDELPADAMLALLLPLLLLLLMPLLPGCAVLCCAVLCCAVLCWAGKSLPNASSPTALLERSWIGRASWKHSWMPGAWQHTMQRWGCAAANVHRVLLLLLPLLLLLLLCICWPGLYRSGTS